MNLPTQINIDAARLPANYEAAKQSLAVCSRVDECKDWADKAIALASYAKQANDDALLTLANRIKARAVERMGQLFEQVEPQSGQRTDITSETRPTEVGREAAAREAGVSQDQRKQSQSIAKFARENPGEFESLVESDKPPTISALADLARGGVNLSASTEALGMLRRFAEFCAVNDADQIAAALVEHERARALSHARSIVEWITKLASIIGSDKG